TTAPAPAPAHEVIQPGQQSVPGHHPIASMFGATGGFDMSQLPQMIQQAMAQGNVTVVQSGKGMVYDARNIPGLRAQILGQLKQYGIDVAAMQVSGQLPPSPPMPAEQAPQQ